MAENLLEKVEGQKAKIGELLLRYTNLTEEQLQNALDMQKESGMLIGDILLKKNFIHPHDVVKVICYQINIPYINEIKIDEIDQELVENIPINYAKSNEFIPTLKTDYSVSVVMSDPFNMDVVNDLQELFHREVKILVSSPLKIQEAINRVYEKTNRDMVDSLEEEFSESLDLDGPIDILDAGADEAPVIRFVNSIIFRSVKEGASDVHIEPYERESIYRFRINGIMTEILRQPIATHASVSARIKVLAKLDIAEKRLPQDGRIKIKMAGKDVDIRLSTVPVQNGERIVMRVLEKSSKILRLEELGFHGKTLKDLDDLIRRKHGILYVCGPTGSGKTTTLFACLDRINSPDKMIITVEDPVEYEIVGVSQIQINHKIDLTFARSLRSIVRQDPDVIMVGETRDLETAQTAIEASLTGHFVFSTIHTNDAPSSATRLIEMGVQPFLIASSLVGVMAQRLVQSLCKECKVPHDMSKAEMDIFGISKIPSDATIFQAKGCPKCNHRGYEGRTVVSELMVIDDSIRSLVLQRADAAQIKKAAIKQGMKTLRDDAIHKVYQGIISVEEVIRVINEDEREQEGV